MRRLLVVLGYKLDDETWGRNPEDPTFPDARIEEEHFRYLIETMAAEAKIARAKLFERMIGGSR